MTAATLPPRLPCPKCHGVDTELSVFRVFSVWVQVKCNACGKVGPRAPYREAHVRLSNEAAVLMWNRMPRK